MLIGNSSFYFEIANFLLKFKDLIVLIKKRNRSERISIEILLFISGGLRVVIKD